LKARRNPLAKLESFIQGIVERPFAWLFPSRLEPVEVMRKLERAMEDNTFLQSEGRRLAPNVYDIYVSIKDHQQMSTSQDILIRDWQSRLVEFALQRHFTLRTMPIIRLHADTSLSTSIARIETAVADNKSGAVDGVVATQALSAEQIAALRAQLAGTPGAAALGNAGPGTSPSTPQAGSPGQAGQSYGGQPQTSSPSHNVTLPQAWLTIHLPQAGQQIYRIEKPVVNVGRQLSNDIIVEDKRVSRYHAQIKYQPDGQFMIFDLGSTNGITVNNVPGLRQHHLRSGDRFKIGSYDFYFERR